MTGRFLWTKSTDTGKTKLILDFDEVAMLTVDDNRPHVLIIVFKGTASPYTITYASLAPVQDALDMFLAYATKKETRG